MPGARVQDGSGLLPADKMRGDKGDLGVKQEYGDTECDGVRLSSHQGVEPYLGR